MLTLPPEDLLPVIVADLADADARDALEAAVFTGKRVWVPLTTAPVSTSEHVLEVHTPATPEPLFYIAWPLGPPTKDGFPLRLEPMSATERGASSGRAIGKDLVPAVVRGRSRTNLNLSESHTKDLSHVGPLPTEDTHDATIGRALAGGKLVIEQLIGRGGVGAVYKARHRELMMPVAVKVLHESFQKDIDFCRRFYAEALAASRLDHPNVTRVIDFGQEPDGQLYIAMEFLDGMELRTVLDKERRLASTRIAALMMQVCAGLSHAHARGIVHRDIKPENLVLVPSFDDDGKPTEIVKVCDFGIALQRSRQAQDSNGVIAGTPEYMSPEQCRDGALDARSDVYACGVVLYELATGQPPFRSENPADLLDKHLSTKPLPPSKIDRRVEPQLEKIILKALAKDPAARQQSMRELRAELREILAGEGATDRASSQDLVAAEELKPPPPLPPRRALATLPEDFISAETVISEDIAQPTWLVRGAAYGTVPVVAPAPTPNTTSTHIQAATPASEEKITALADSALSWAARLARTTDPTVFEKAAQELEPALRALATRGDVGSLWHISTTMHTVASEGRPVAGTRAWAASKLLRVFEDPGILVQIAEQLLNGPAESRDDARRLLVHAGVAGAYGLYGARVKLARIGTIRTLFVAVLKDFGPRAWPVVRASLEKIAITTTPNVATIELAEDLLLCVPLIGDESAGHVALKFLRWTHSGVCRAAAAAIVQLWGERAKPVFVAMVQSKDDVVRVTGIAGLRQLKAVDEHLIPRLHAILSQRVPAGEEVQAAAAVALGHASSTARQPAISVLAQLLSAERTPAPLPRSLSSTLSKQDAVVIAMAKSLLTIGGPPYRGLVAERAERSPEPLRGQLRGLLTQP